VQKIHAVLGTPSPEVLAKLKKHSNAHIDFNFPHKNATPFAKLIAHASSDAVDLIAKLLAYNPEDRISARQALRHPLFRDIREAEKRGSDEESELLSGVRSKPTASQSQPFSTSLPSIGGGSGAIHAPASLTAADGGVDGGAGSLPPIGAGCGLGASGGFGTAARGNGGGLGTGAQAPAQQPQVGQQANAYGHTTFAQRAAAGGGLGGGAALGGNAGAHALPPRHPRVNGNKQANLKLKKNLPGGSNLRQQGVSTGMAGVGVGGIGFGQAHAHAGGGLGGGLGGGGGWSGGRTQPMHATSSALHPGGGSHGGPMRSHALGGGSGAHGADADDGLPSVGSMHIGGGHGQAGGMRGVGGKKVGGAVGAHARTGGGLAGKAPRL
ncbi:hypothetical protein T492DRAFT_895487, partial [Pavlovales sp. CCMP2436]